VGGHEGVESGVEKRREEKGRLLCLYVDVDGFSVLFKSSRAGIESKRTRTQNLKK
jgi:hypothetical protein